MGHGPRVLVGVPVYNEQRHVANVLAEIRRYADDVLVIDDGSTDETPMELARLPVEVIRHAENRGYGRSMQDMLRWARFDGFDWLITMDCDEQHEPARSARLLQRPWRMRRAESGADALEALSLVVSSGGGIDRLCGALLEAVLQLAVAILLATSSPAAIGAAQLVPLAVLQAAFGVWTLRRQPSADRLASWVAGVSHLAESASSLTLLIAIGVPDAANSTGRKLLIAQLLGPAVKGCERRH